MKFYIVDAFTQEKFGGNPAGVVILPEGADFPSDELMVKTSISRAPQSWCYISGVGLT